MVGYTLSTQGTLGSLGHFFYLYTNEYYEYINEGRKETGEERREKMYKAIVYTMQAYGRSCWSLTVLFPCKCLPSLREALPI